MFKFGKVDFIGECCNRNKVLVFKVFYTIDGEDKDIPFLVYDGGTYKTSIEEHFQSHVSKRLINDRREDLGMSDEERESCLNYVKSLVNKWCRDLSYPELERNIFDSCRDQHLM